MLVKVAVVVETIKLEKFVSAGTLVVTMVTSSVVTATGVAVGSMGKNSVVSTVSVESMI